MTVPGWLKRGSAAVGRWLKRPTAAVLAAGILAGCLNFAFLTRPGEYVFDEVYYAKDACLYTGRSLKECDVTESAEKYWVRERDEVGSWVHPPVGKWMIAAGEFAFGSDPLGWRFSAAVVGAMTVMMVTGMAWLFFRSSLWAFTTGLVLATDGLFFVQSRLALLDIFLAFWVTMGFLFLVLDRRWIHRRANRAEPRTGREAADTPPPTGLPDEPPAPMPGPETGVAPDTPVVTDLPPSVPSPLWRPWRLAMGIAFGLACGTKWSGAYALVGAIGISLWWEVARRKKSGVPKPLRQAIWQESLGLVLLLGFVPVIVYVAAYARFWVLNGLHPTKFWDLQTAAAKFHAGLDRLKENGKLSHPYESRPWDWFPLARPVNFYFEGPGAQVIDLGNPVLFWSSIVTIPYAVYRAARDPRAQLLSVAILVQYLPWFLPPMVNRVQFFFYMTPIVPFMALTFTYAMRDLAAYRPRAATSKPFLPVAVGLVALHVALFVYFWPVLTAYPLTTGGWQARMWFPGWV